MNTQSIQVVNSSNTNEIMIKLTPPENAQTPENKFPIVIPLKSSKEVAVRGGVMNIFVWMNHNRGNLDNKMVTELVWKGIIPTKTIKPIIIIPEKKKIMHDGMELPSNFRPVTGTEVHHSEENRENEPQRPTNNEGWWTYFIVCLVIVLIIIGIFYGMWYRGYFSSRQK